MTPERLAEIRAWSQKGSDVCPSVVHVRELLAALREASSLIERFRAIAEAAADLSSCPDHADTSCVPWCEHCQSQRDSLARLDAAIGVLP